MADERDAAPAAEVVDEHPGTVDPTPANPVTGATLHVDLAWQSVVVAIVALLVVWLLWGAVRMASTSMAIIVVALFLGMALDPVVNSIRRRTRLGRGWATVLVISMATLLIGLFLSIAGPQLVKESANLEQQLPATIRSLDDLPLVGHTLKDADLSQKLTDALSSLSERTGGDGSSISGIVATVGFGVVAFLLAFFLVAGVLFEGPRLIGDIRTAIPVARRDAADEMGRIVYRVLAKYFAGSILIATLNGMWVAVAALVVGVPLSPVLGVWTALTALIPQIGGLMGFALVLVVSLTEGVGATAVMSLAFLAFMLLSNHILIPTVVGKAVSLSPPVTMLAAIGGFSVGGIIGALFAVPTFGAIKAVVMHVSGRDEPDVEEHHESRHGLDRVRRWFRHLRHRSSPDAGAAAG
ncbi:MAG: AI-2E family transporter [Actinomycetota bacterium]|nr:AI-2E family transporter [Actinomycetota bacterium]